MPYLVRRLLENGANSSFVHRLVDARCPVESLTQHPVDALLAFETLHNTNIPLPPQIFLNAKTQMGSILIFKVKRNHSKIKCMVI
ncbi:proline dehydrogenase family protein [Vibrio metschnikovii]